jgi:hypothetical protein
LDIGVALSRASILASLLAALLAGCGDLPTPRTCSSGATCSAGSWCRSGQCVANAPPEALIEVPPSAGSNRPVTFRGGGSHDIDPGDSVTSWAWKTSAPAGTTGCEPLPATGSGADFTVVFPCGGDHDLSLTVTDSLGLAGAERTVRVHVEATLDPPALFVAPDLSVDHLCSGAPLSCTPWNGISSSIGLSATGIAPPGATFTFRWSVELPPQLASQPPPRVTFTPDETAAEPKVLIETAGTAIAGRYTFAVAATDSRGMVAVGRQRVDVGNRPPVVSGGGAIALSHAYEAATRSFVAAGNTPATTWTDPDGDPVGLVGFSSSRSGDGGNVFDVQGQGDHARLTVVVPYTRPGDAAFLLGPDVRRHVDLVVADVNGARGAAGWDVTISNRAPRLATAVTSVSVDHSFESAAQRYAAQAALSSWVDDDGDPIELSGSGDPLCLDVANRQGTAWVTCSLAYPGRPAVASFAGTRSILVAARDPFEDGPSQATTLEIRNRPPRPLAAFVEFFTSCAKNGGCCEIDPETRTCMEFTYRYDPASMVVPLVVDDDGDPLDLAATSSAPCLTVAAGPPGCGPGGCSFELSLCGNPSVCSRSTTVASLALSASDGLGSLSTVVGIDDNCR